MIRPIRYSHPISATTDLRLQPHRWYHVAVVVQGKRLLTYVNGALATLVELPREIEPAEESTPFGFTLGQESGATANPNPNAFVGQMDEVRL